MRSRIGVSGLVALAVCSTIFISVWIGGSAFSGPDKDQSQCVACHTDASKLIKISWEIEKLTPKRAKSKETAGEG